MTMATETNLPGGGYEQHYCLTLGGKQFLRVCRRPVSIAPAEGQVVFVDKGERHGTIGRYGAATYKDGKFSGVKFEPTHWSELVHG